MRDGTGGRLGKKSSRLCGGRDEKVGGQKYNYVLTVLIRVETHPKAWGSVVVKALRY